MQRIISRHSLAILALSAISTLSIRSVLADPPTLLQQISSDTQHLYDKVRLGVVRVQLPTPQWLEQLNEQEKLLHKWGGQLSPEVLQQLKLEQEKARSEQYRQVGAVAATTQPTETATTQAVASSTTQPLPGGLQFSPRNLPTPEVGNRVLVAIGLLVNTDGYVVVPLYVDQKTIGNTPLKVLMGDGRLTSARYIGSDRPTNLTVIQLENHTGSPVALSHGRPDEGSLTMVISSDGSARLAIWTTQHPETGLVVTPDGAIAGFGLNTGMLTAATCKPIVDQIIATGQVHRAVLGVLVKEIRKEDNLRQAFPALGVRPAIRVEYVDPNSAAQRGGLRVGDLILSIGNDPVGETQTFAALIATRSGKTTLHVMRESQELDLAVDLKPQ